jgi:3',5'-cyclic AMP phosphodiesterase CpdA
MATWTEDPSTTVTLTWERKAPEGMRVAVAPVIEGAAAAFSEERGASRRHVQTFRGLKPNTRYAYAIRGENGYEAEGRFWTAPADGHTPFRFILQNDLQGGLREEAAQAVSAAVIQANPDFVLSTGDLGDSRYAHEYADVIHSWKQFFTLLEKELSLFVFQPVAGNHDEPENPDSFWHRLFELPGDGRNYTLDVGPIRFIGVDSSEFEVPAQVPWLARELQRAAFDPEVTWVIPAFHRPPFSEGARGGQDIVRDWWVPLFTKYEADLVLSGHAHTYQRTKPIDGVNYLVSGGAGGYLYAVDPTHPTMAFATSVNHFVQFHVDGGEIRLEATTPAAEVFDRAAYVAHRYVRVEPVFPVRGELCTIWYNPEGGPLEGVEEVWIHIGRDEFNNLLMDLPMQKDEVAGMWKATFKVPDSPRWNLAFCFFEPKRGIWHNNHKQNWQALLQRDW